MTPALAEMPPARPLASTLGLAWALAGLLGRAIFGFAIFGFAIFGFAIFLNTTRGP